MASLEVQIAAGTGDGYAYTPGNGFTNDATYPIYIGQSGGYVCSNFLRFANVAIPAGAIINSAVIRHVANSSLAGTTCKCKIYGEAADNPSAASSYSDYWARSRTSNYLSWTVPAWAAETDYDSPDISIVVQEIVNRAGWASGNALQLFEQDDGSNNNATRTFYCYDTSASKAAKLVVTYTTGVEKTSSDSGSGAESASLVDKDNFAAETGTGTDSGGIVVDKESSDGGTGSENGGLLQSFYSSDAGSGADSLKMISGKAGADVKLRSHQGQVGLPHKEVSI